jgi:cell fate (sporulation/competence/biofilm development) regulator YlbF (YheA/YmcA/DUF963 family)
MEKILEAANTLGHLLKKNEIVTRYHEFGEELEKNEEAKKLLDEYMEFTTKYRMKEEKGEAIEVSDKEELSEFQEKLQKNELITKFMATQAYYMSIIQKVNERISNPEGEPPKESSIITPGNDTKIIV